MTKITSGKLQFRKHVLSVAISFCYALPAASRTITVDTIPSLSGQLFCYVDVSNDGKCSLKEAMATANKQDPGNMDCGASSSLLEDDEISFASGGDSVECDLTSVDNVTDGPNGLPSVVSHITIQGGSKGALIKWFQSTDPFSPVTPPFRILHVAADWGLVLNNVTISGGKLTSGNDATGAGAGVLNRGVLSLNQSTISSNSANSSGGGVYNLGGGAGYSGVVQVNHSTISDNFAFSGGGIRSVGNASTVLIIDQGTIKNNTATYGGGAYIGASTIAVLRGSTISQNSASKQGGGILNYHGYVNAKASTISGNSATIRGGGIQNDGTPNGTLILDSSTVSDNSSANGGGVGNNSATAYLANSTISGNSSIYGGGILNLSSEATLLHSTVANNTAVSGEGGGMKSDTDSVYNPSMVELKNTIIANNAGGNCNTPLSSSLGDWFDDNSCNGANRGDPKLGPLQNNGGRTKTHALFAKSLAIDGADTGACNALVNQFDQRGVERPQGKKCDIGAYEYESPSFFSIPLKSGKSVIFSL